MLYKYRRDGEFTEAIFTARRVHLSTAAELNDPFECSLQEIGEEWAADKIRTLKEAHLGGFLWDAHRTIEEDVPFFDLAPSGTKELLARLKTIQEFDGKYREFRKFMASRTGYPPSDPDVVFTNMDRWLNAVGIFSMSEVADHPLMWAHYAADHRGICLGFEASPGSRLSRTENCLKVTYSDVLPRMDGEGFSLSTEFSLDAAGRLFVSEQRISFSDRTFQAAISTKASAWAYEREWRYVEPVAGDVPWPGRLSEIVFGLRCPKDRREYYMNLAAEHVPNPVKFSEIRKVANSNALSLASVGAASTPSRAARDRAALDRAARDRTARDRALRDREAAARLVPTPPLAIDHQIEALFSAGRPVRALKVIDEALLTRPGDAALLDCRGRALGTLKMDREALACFELLTTIEPTVGRGWYHKGVALIALGRTREASESLRNARRLDPLDASAAFNLGIVLSGDEGGLDEALLHLEDAGRLGHSKAGAIVAKMKAEQVGSVGHAE